MPNLTPLKYRRMYEIYPAKACIDESAADCSECLRAQIRSLGRFAGSGPGGRGTAGMQTGTAPNASSQLVQLVG
jgi:biotin synthase